MDRSKQVSRPAGEPLPKRLRSERGGSSAADRRREKRPLSDTNSPKFPTFHLTYSHSTDLPIPEDPATMSSPFRREKEVYEGIVTACGEIIAATNKVVEFHEERCKEYVPPPSGADQPTIAELASSFKFLSELETKREAATLKLQGDLSSTTDKLDLAMKMIGRLESEKKVMETSHDAMVSEAVRNTKKKLSNQHKKYLAQKTKELACFVKLSKVKSRLKMVELFRAGNFDLMEEEEKLRDQQLEFEIDMATLSVSDFYLDKSDAGAGAGPSGTAHEPDPHSSDDGLGGDDGALAE